MFVDILVDKIRAIIWDSMIFRSEEGKDSKNASLVEWKFL